MKPKFDHSWVLSEDQAYQLQSELAKKVIRSDQLGEIKNIAGVDVAYDETRNILVAGVVILDAGTLNPIESVVIKDEARFPYVPGLFSFRELPPVIKALEKVKTAPDLVVCDGQGIAHPRRFGLACHLGVLFDLPTIGCGKTNLVGDFEVPGYNRGDFSNLIDQEEVVGSVLRTQTSVRPVYVSIGNKVSIESAMAWILRLSPNFRLPETTRRVDQLVRAEMRRV